MYMVFDEGHCVSQWGRSFRNEYLHVGTIRYLLPNTIPFYVASATLPQSVLRDVSEILRLRPSQLEYIIRSNDRPNINLVVRPIEHALESYDDLAFLIPEGWKEGDPPPKKFAVFMDNTTHTEAATKAIRKRLPPHLRNKIRWFHATMTNEYRDENLEAFRKGEIWGLFVTDAFGMVRLCSNPLCISTITYSLLHRALTFPTLNSLFSTKRVVISTHSGNASVAPGVLYP